MYPQSHMRIAAKPFVFALTATLLTGFLCIFPVLTTQAAPGDLDTSFGTDGKVTTDISTTDRGNGIAIQTDGKILVTGSAGVGISDFAVVRYIAHSSLSMSAQRAVPYPM